MWYETSEDETKRIFIHNHYYFINIIYKTVLYFERKPLLYLQLHLSLNIYESILAVNRFHNKLLHLIGRILLIN